VHDHVRPNFAFALATKRTRDKDLVGLDLSRIRIAGCGSEAINPLVLQAFAERFSHVGFNPSALMPSYGMAEATLALSFHPHGKPLLIDRVRPLRSSSAKATPGDPERRQCGLGQLWTRRFRDTR